MGAASVRKTPVECAWIAVITRPLIDVSVAVIVEPVTEVLGRLEGVTRAQPRHLARPDAVAGPEVVHSGTRGRQRQLNGGLRAVAGAAVGDTLSADTTIHGGGLLAGEPLGARLVVAARATAKGAGLAIIQAGVHAPFVRALQLVRAGTAQQREVGDTQEGGIPAAVHLLTGPARRAGLITGLRAGLVPHVGHAYAREAVIGTRTRVSKTSVTRLTAWLRRNVVARWLHVRCGRRGVHLSCVGRGSCQVGAGLQDLFRCLEHIGRGLALGRRRGFAADRAEDQENQRETTQRSRHFAAPCVLEPASYQMPTGPSPDEPNMLS